MWNEAILIGRLGRDPEVRHTQGGSKVCNFSIATDEKWKDKNTGEQKERTEWHRVCAFGRLADIAEQILVKGSLVAVRGTIRTRKWTDQSGNEKYSTEVVLDGFESRLKLLANGKPRDEAAADNGSYGGEIDDGYDPEEIPF